MVYRKSLIAFHQIQTFINLLSFGLALCKLQEAGGIHSEPPMFSKLPCIISLPRHYVGIMYAISMIYIYYIYKKISKKSYIIEVYTISTRFLLKNYVYHPSYPDHLSTVSNISIYTYLCLSISIYINLYLPISIRGCTS